MVAVKNVRRIGAAALVLPAADHLIAPTLTMLFAPAVMSSMFGEAGAIPTTTFFIVLGAFQVFCMWVLLKSNSPSLLSLGVFGNLVSIVIYFVSAAGVTLPFGVPPQPFGVFAVLVKALEAGFVLTSVYVLKSI
jgi:hypothetical protein